MTLNLEALDAIPKILERQDALLLLLEKRAVRQWYYLREACELKGVSYNTVKSNPDYQPRGGKPDAIMHGRKAWKRETVQEWVGVADDNRMAYLVAQA